MNWLLAGIGGVLLIWALAWIGVNARVSTALRWTKWILVALIVGGVLTLAATGQFRTALMAGLMLFPLLFSWRRRQAFHAGRGAGPRAGTSSMSVAEAAEILGVSPNAEEKAIKEAYHRMMTEHHPDKGGSAWFARQINEARDVLLAACGR